MFGIADYGAFSAAIIILLALPGRGTYAPLTTIAVLTALYRLTRCAFAHWAGAKVRPRRGVARGIQRLAGPFPVGFSIKLGTQ